MVGLSLGSKCTVGFLSGPKSRCFVPSCPRDSYIIFFRLVRSSYICSRVILVNMVISVILGHEKTKIQNIIDLGKIDVFSVKTIIHNNNKKMGHLI